MLSVIQMTAFSDELQKIATIKIAILPTQSPTQTRFEAPPVNALGTVKPKTVKPNSSKANAYAKPVNIPATSSAVGVQPVSISPSVMS